MNENENEILSYLASLGLKQKAIEVLIGILVKIELRDRSRSNGDDGVYMTYDWFDSQFKNCPQKWSKVNEVIRGVVVSCDFDAAFGFREKSKNKAYCYRLLPHVRLMILDYLKSDFFKKVDRDGKKWAQKFKDLKKGVRNIVSIGDIMGVRESSPIRPDKSPFHSNPIEFFNHNLEFLKKVELAEDIRLYIQKEIERMESMSEGTARNSLISKLISELANLKNLRDGVIKIEFSRDGRWHQNGYVGLSKELKKLLTVNGKPFQGVIDVRSCHLSLLGFYLLSLNSNLSEEVTRWNAIVLNPAVKPTAIIQDMLIERDLFIALDDVATEDGQVIDGIKTILNKFINGSGRLADNSLNKSHQNYRVNKMLDEWISLNFPGMHKTWLETKIRDTGVNISKNWETPIMQHPEIFEKATDLGVYVANEHDGVGFYAETGEHLPTILETIQNVAKKHFGINLVVVEKSGLKRKGTEWFMESDEAVIRSRKIQIEQIKTLKTRIGKQVRNAAFRKNWTEMNNFKKRKDQLEIEILKKQIELFEQYEVLLMN